MPCPRDQGWGWCQHHHGDDEAPARALEQHRFDLRGAADTQILFSKRLLTGCEPARPGSVESADGEPRVQRDPVYRGLTVKLPPDF